MAYPCLVGRMVISPISTSAGCSIAKAIVRATASAGMPSTSMLLRICPLRARDVGGAAGRPAAAVADGAGDGIDPVAAARPEDDRGTALRQQARRGLADAAARSGDGDDRAVDA